jgi:hypothetical protein
VAFLNFSIMDGCSNCWSSKKAQDERLSVAQKNAKEKAGNERRSVAIVMENGEYILYDAFHAYSAGMALMIKEVISYMQ